MAVTEADRVRELDDVAKPSARPRGLLLSQDKPSHATIEGFIKIGASVSRPSDNVNNPAIFARC